MQNKDSLGRGGREEGKEEIWGEYTSDAKS